MAKAAIRVSAILCQVSFPAPMAADEEGAEVEPLTREQAEQIDENYDKAVKEAQDRADKTLMVVSDDDYSEVNATVSVLRIPKVDPEVVKNTVTLENPRVIGAAHPEEVIEVNQCSFSRSKRAISASS